MKRRTRLIRAVRKWELEQWQNFYRAKYLGVPITHSSDNRIPCDTCPLSERRMGRFLGKTEARGLSELCCHSCNAEYWHS